MSDQQEQQTESAIKVRQLTDYQASWTEEERGAPGAFTFQLILDNGAEEYVLRPTADDAKVMLKLFKRSQSVYFDLDRARARGARQVLLPADPGQRRRGVRHPAPGRGLGRLDGSLQEEQDHLLRYGTPGPHLREHLPGLKAGAKPTRHETGRQSSGAPFFTCSNFREL